MLCLGFEPGAATQGPTKLWRPPLLTRNSLFKGLKGLFKETSILLWEHCLDPRYDLFYYRQS